MEPNGLGGGMFPSISSGLLGVENLQNQQNPHPLHHPQMVPYSIHHESDTHSQPQQQIKHNYTYSTKPNNNKKSQTTLSDEDEPGFTAEDGDPKRKVSPWHRMKWTDAMVRLLIMAVYYIGDEAGSEGTDPNGKKKGTGLLQKKGKWKSVSRGMMEKGYYVSPQQCEDKFNDLNKRHKRVNDILGKGTACRVVENQSLLDTMDLSPKMKEEVRKLLNSKHLFFREMCAYHNSCCHGTGVGPSNNNNLQETVTTEGQPQPQQQQQQQQQLQQPCFHSSKILKEDEEDEENKESDEDSDEEEEESGSRGQAEEEDNEVRKRSKKSASSTSQVIQQLSSQVTGILQDGGKSSWEKKQWMKKRVVELEEKQVSYQVEAFELEKQRLKWARFSSKKEREMERDKLENERRRLEIERIVLLLRHKEFELLNIHQQQQHSST